MNFQRDEFMPEDTWTQQEVADFLDVKPAMVRKYMRGWKGMPRMPYVRVTRAPLFSKIQVAEWLRQVQELGDSQMATVRHARQQLGTTDT